MKKALKKLLKSLGATDEQITAIAAAMEKDAEDSLEEFPNANDLLTSVRAQISSVLKNDTEFLKPIQEAATGKERSQIERKLAAKFGLTADEMVGKKYDEIVELAHGKALANGNKTAEELQKEALELRAALKKLNEEDIPKIKSEVENEKKTLRRHDKLKSMISGKGLRVPLEGAFPSVMAALTEKYDITESETGEIKFLVKGTQMAPQNSDKTALLTVDEIITEPLKTYKFIEESNGEGGKDDQSAVVIKTGARTDTAPTNNYEHVSKAEKHLQTIKTAPTKT